MTTPRADTRPSTTPPAAIARLGRIAYLNVAPTYDWLARAAHAGSLPNIELIEGVPARMNRALETGEADIANVSSYAFGAHAREWLLTPGLSVSGHGQVDSVLLFSWRDDWRELDGGSIALTDHSATSVELTKLLAECRYGARPRYVTTAPDLEAMLATNDAALLIGDIALREGYLRRDIAGRGRPYVFDLAAEWQAWTGLPFVFSVFAARADRVEAVRAAGVSELLRGSTVRGLANIERIAAEASERLELPATVCADYLRMLKYDLNDRELEGLRLYLEMAIPGFSWADVRLLEEC